MSRDGGIARRYKRNKQMIPFAKRLLKEMSIPCCLNNDPSVSLAADSSLYAREPRGAGCLVFRAGNRPASAATPSVGSADSSLGEGAQGRFDIMSTITGNSR